jgi:adenosylhomocysteine nucleosidase
MPFNWMYEVWFSFTFKRKQIELPYSRFTSPFDGPMLEFPMLLIAAAMQEELNPVMDLCHTRRKLHGCSVSLWEASRGDKKILFLKTEVGPRRSALRLECALDFLRPTRVLVTGYAGALDPRMKVGTLVPVSRAFACTLSEGSPSWEDAKLDGVFELNGSQDLADTARSAGLAFATGDVLTSSYVVGIPKHKRFLYEAFHASIVDMETACLARVARSRNVSLSCIRVISDEAEDTFLASFSYDPAVGIPARAARLIGTGVQVYRKWKENRTIAIEALSRFFAQYLQNAPSSREAGIGQPSRHLTP